MAFKALVVDDMASDRRIAGGILEKQTDLEVVYAADGVEALAAIGAEAPHVVVTDMQMPNMDGLELVRTVRDGGTSYYIRGDHRETMPALHELLTERIGN